MRGIGAWFFQEQKHLRQPHRPDREADIPGHMARHHRREHANARLRTLVARIL